MLGGVRASRKDINGQHFKGCSRKHEEGLYDITQCSRVFGELGGSYIKQLSCHGEQNIR
jgi:hypothetical protein